MKKKPMLRTIELLFTKKLYRVLSFVYLKNIISYCITDSPNKMFANSGCKLLKNNTYLKRLLGKTQPANVFG